MNVYEKLQKARVLLQSNTLKKSGKNVYSNYDYFELQDFLPAINKIFDDLKLSSVLKIVNEQAVFIVANSEKTDEKIVFKAPFEVPILKGANSIQNIGAGITYIRRYMLLIALEIVENDIVDSKPLETVVKENKQDDNLELEKKFKSLVKIKNIPSEKMESVKLMQERIKSKNYSINNLKNAITFLDKLENKGSV